MNRPLPHPRISACLLIAAALLLGACSSPPRETTPQTAAGGEAWRADVAAISTHGDSPGRRAALERLLSGAGLEGQAIRFSHQARQGTNLIAPVSGAAGRPLLLLGAHYDQVDAGNGVTDNAGGCAVALELARRFRQHPLRNHRVSVAFWDLEEKGLLGATAYVEGEGEKPALYVNFDVFAWGDTLWMMTPDAAHPLVAASRSAAQSRGIGLSAGEQYPPTDHLAFLRAGWPAVSYSLVGSGEIEAILRMFSGQQVANPPKVMKVIHTADDTLQQVEPAQAAAGIDAVEAALRAWDAGAG